MIHSQTHRRLRSLQTIIKIYPGFEDSFNQALIGIPSGIAGLTEPFYGSVIEAKDKHPQVFQSNQKLTTVLYMEGSGEFSKAFTLREWITGEGGYLFLAPNSHTGKGRPTYTSPASKAIYEQVHAYRQAEIQYAISRLDELPFIDTTTMFLMGNSEGALAAARYSGDEFKARIVLSWTCESGYFTDFPAVGSSPENPFLNIVGRDDAYFGRLSAFNKNKNNQGHCGEALAHHPYAKIVILPNTGHDVVSNPYTKPEVLGFIKTINNFLPNPK